VPEPDVVPGVAQHDVPGELQQVAVRAVVLEGDAGAVRLPAVDLDDQPAIRPGEVDARFHAVLRERRGDAVAAADLQESVLEVGLGDRGVVEVGLEAGRRSSCERIPDAVVVEHATEVRLPDHAVEGLVIEGVCEVGEGPAMVVTGMPWRVVRSLGWSRERWTSIRARRRSVTAMTRVSPLSEMGNSHSAPAL
jgi:hypothetical protein